MLLRRAPPPPSPKIGVTVPQQGQTNPLMFSMMPTIGVFTSWNIFRPLTASASATSCGVVTMTAPESGNLLRQGELNVAGAGGRSITR